MTHIAIMEQRDGKIADWMEKVGDEQYQTELRAERGENIKRTPKEIL